MATSEGHPRIQIEYFFKKEDLETVPYFLAASLSYVGERNPEEAVYVEAEANVEFAFVKIGRYVLPRMSNAEIIHQAELMREDIESNDALLANDIDASKSFVGQRPLGDNIPAAE